MKTVDESTFFSILERIKFKFTNNSIILKLLHNIYKHYKCISYTKPYIGTFFNFKDPSHNKTTDLIIAYYIK